MSFEHRALESLILLLWLAVLFAVMRAVAGRFGSLRFGSELIAGLAVILFLVGSGWHPTTRLRAVADQPVQAGPQPSPGQSAAPQQLAGCVVGNRPKPGALGHIDALRLGEGAVQAPQPVLSIATSTALHLAGWIALPTHEKAEACLVIDGRIVSANGTYGIARADVSAALNDPTMSATGFDIVAVVGSGTHTVTVAAVKGDSSVELVQSIRIVAQ